MPVTETDGKHTPEHSNYEAALNDGGPAFSPDSSATLRDWFAYGVAPTVVAICAGDHRDPDETVAQYVARRAYEVADAMLTERQPTNGKTGTSEANAPDMLKACKPIADELGLAEWASPEGAEEILQKLIRELYPPLRAAIAKAQGRALSKSA